MKGKIYNGKNAKRRTGLFCLTLAIIFAALLTGQPGFFSFFQKTVSAEVLGGTYYKEPGQYEIYTPAFEYDNFGKKVFGTNGEKTLAVGIDVFAYNGKHANYYVAKDQLEAAKEANCNTVTIPCVWFAMEKTEGVYDWDRFGMSTEIRTDY